MKSFSFVLLSTVIGLFIQLTAVSQTNSIVIGQSGDSMYVVNAHDTVFTSLYQGGWYVKLFYSIDFDQNGIPDFTFSTEGYMGGMGSWSYFQLNSNDNSWFSADSVFTTVGVYDSIGQCHYSQAKVPIAWIYNQSDTLFSDNCSDSTSMDIARYSYSEYNNCLRIHLENWISGAHYIGIRKRINNVDYLGWIKVEVKDDYTMIIKEYALNHSFVGIPVIAETHPVVYPNPVESTLFIASQDCNKVEIYTVLGTLVKVVDFKTTGSEAGINVANLTPGVYFVRIYRNGFCITRKIIKN